VSLLLALDTTGDRGSIALADGDRVIEVKELDSPEGFAHVIFGEIEALLSRHGRKIGDVEGFASAAGPGSFTGVRVGLTAAKGLAEATGRKVVAVSNLQALAWFGTCPFRAAVIDARRGQIYGAVYDASLKLVQDEVVIKFEDWERGLPGEGIEMIAAGFEPPATRVLVTRAQGGLAGAIAIIAASRFAEGLAQDPAEIDANYVRRSDAELLWRDPR
jgi:tRNA threonylcarbamoyladenosine biosynthesis protein TsaB